MDRDEPDWTWWNEARAIARRHAHGASDAADDLAQELAVAALERGAHVERTGAWLERVGRNAAIDRWREERRRRALIGEVDGPTPSVDPEARTLARERRGVLRRALAELPRPLRRATLARFHADLSFAGVAARLGTEPVTARTRVHRALARLRVRLGALRVVLVAWPGAQATVLGVVLVAGVARPALFPVVEVQATPRVAARLASPPRVRHFAQAEAQAPARPEALAPPRAPARSQVARSPTPAVQTFSYDDDVVDGLLEGPDGIGVVGTPRLEHLSLIELRQSFVPEIVKTLEDL
jgi:RNA polymerase sigma-70 factor, ECF subfamily